jgi:hypothetical protein
MTDNNGSHIYTRGLKKLLIPGYWQTADLRVALYRGPSRSDQDWSYTRHRIVSRPYVLGHRWVDVTPDGETLLFKVDQTYYVWDTPWTRLSSWHDKVMEYLFGHRPEKARCALHADSYVIYDSRNCVPIARVAFGADMRSLGKGTQFSLNMPQDAFALSTTDYSYEMLSGIYEYLGRGKGDGTTAVG